MELKRLRIDNEKLAFERDALSTKLRQADSEKKDLANNFGYVKSEYDRMLQGSAVGVRESREYQQLQHDKQLLQQRVEQLTQELEKGKVSSGWSNSHKNWRRAR